MIRNMWSYGSTVEAPCGGGCVWGSQTPNGAACIEVCTLGYCFHERKLRSISASFFRSIFWLKYRRPQQLLSHAPTPMRLKREGPIPTSCSRSVGEQHRDDQGQQHYASASGKSEPCAVGKQQPTALICGRFQGTKTRPHSGPRNNATFDLFVKP